MTSWYVREGNNEPLGPVSTELLVRGISAGKVPIEAEVLKEGTREWLPLEAIEAFSDAIPSDGVETKVIESPWFMHQSDPDNTLVMSSPGHPEPLRSAPHAVPPPPPARGRPPPPPPPAASRPGPAPRQAAAADAYAEYDDDAMTRVARPPSDALSSPSPLTSPGYPSRSGGPPPPPTLASSPRPAAGARQPPRTAPVYSAPAPAPAPHSAPVPLAPTMNMHESSGFPPPQAGMPPAPMPPTSHPPYSGGAPQGPLPPQYPQPRHPAPAGGLDGGMKALIALIGVLAVALAVVVILLLRR